MKRCRPPWTPFQRLCQISCSHNGSELPVEIPEADKEIMAPGRLRVSEFDTSIGCPSPAVLSRGPNIVLAIPRKRLLRRYEAQMHVPNKYDRMMDGLSVLKVCSCGLRNLKRCVHVGKRSGGELLCSSFLAFSKVLDLVRYACLAVAVRCEKAKSVRVPGSVSVRRV